MKDQMFVFRSCLKTPFCLFFEYKKAHPFLNVLSNLFMYNIDRTYERLIRAAWLTPDRKGVMLMSTFQAISLMLLFGMFILALLTYINKK
ncbi:putative holin-like toxin [Bacillus altitudinis]|uniref:putative holin-like toxin n=2 Tax=Bacillaceae TaxID=186817 RepID=UPI003BFA72DE